MSQLPREVISEACWGRDCVSRSFIVWKWSPYVEDTAGIWLTLTDGNWFWWWLSWVPQAANKVIQDRFPAHLPSCHTLCTQMWPWLLWREKLGAFPSILCSRVPSLFPIVVRTVPRFPQPCFSPLTKNVLQIKPDDFKGNSRFGFPWVNSF